MSAVAASEKCLVAVVTVQLIVITAFLYTSKIYLINLKH